MEPQVETTLCVTGGRLDFEAIGDALWAWRRAGNA